MAIRNLILDWSGTLVDDLLPVLHTTNHVMRLHGRPAMSLDEFRRCFRLPVRRFYEDRIPEAQQEDLEREFLAHYPSCRHGIRLLPHARGFLEFCSETRRRVFIASSADPETYETQMARFGVSDYIAKPYLGIEDKTEQIHHILAEQRLDPAETLFVGDMEHDLEAGRAGGVRTCAVLTGYNHGEKLLALSPDLVCADLGELQRLLLAEDAGAKPTL
jgi:phosphoglycolate phosphatase-like HAD superfamily hydrolase